MWSIDRHFHHSIEFYDNDHVVTPINLKENYSQKYPVKNEGFAIINIKTGKIKEETSLLKILEENNFLGLLYGVGEFEFDRIHLNDVEVINKTDKHFFKGDIMFSSKHLSTVFIYRPNSRKIIYYQTGPWLNQHDIDYLGNGEFTIFDNNTFRYDLIESHDVFLNNNNKIYKWIPNKNIYFEIFKETMHSIKTPTQGLHQNLKNGDIYVEDTDNFIIHRMNNEKKRWSFINYLGNQKIGSIHWSRYYDTSLDVGWIRNSIKC